MNSPIGLAKMSSYINKPFQYMNKTKRTRKVHFVFAHTGSHECTTIINNRTIYTKWAPSVTCKSCRDLMVSIGITCIL